ncbi:thioredoxin reductase [Fusarium coicis]|nr:thioredoxin reductase [Fusarium coicis]
MPLVDVLIISAGPAGLSAALALAISLSSLTALSFATRVQVATRKEISEGYKTISFEDREIAKVEKTSAGDFSATAVDGTTFTGRRVLLATAVTDLPLDIKGYAECWGYAIYHCLFGHGYEDTEKPSAGVLVLGENTTPAAATAFARSAKQMTQKVVIYTSNNNTMQTAVADILGERDTGITIDNSHIASLALGPEGSGVTITFGDESSVHEAFLAHKPPTKINGPSVE